jgi:hypothetical protein
VYLRGFGLDLGLAQSILCRFGGVGIVIARVVTPSTLVVCVSPPAVGPPGGRKVEVAVDGRKFFGGVGGGATFTYLADPLFDSQSPNIVPNQVGTSTPTNLTVSGSGFAAATSLAPGFPLCRFRFSATSLTRLTHGEVLNSSQVRCPTPSAALDPRVALEISYNGVEFHLVQSS